VVAAIKGVQPSQQQAVEPSVERFPRLSRGKGWVARYKQGAAALHKAYPEIEVSERLATAA